jgi:predicted ATPase
MLTQMDLMKLIWFNYEAKQWEWDLQKIAAMNVPEDVVGFLLDELDKRNFHKISFGLWVLIIVVPDETRDVLRIAACLGDSNFSLFLLSRIMTISRVEIARRLAPAEQIGLIVSDQSYQVHSPLLILTCSPK